MPVPDPDPPPEYLNQIVTGDARELAKRIPDESVDLIFTDPPYPKEFLSLYGDLAEVAARVLKPGGNLFALAGQYWLMDVLDLVRPHLNYHWMCCLYQPGDNGRCHPRNIFQGWKPLLWFVKGKYEGPYVQDTIVSRRREKRFHEWGQSIGWAEYYIDRLNPNITLDPFTGGGTVPAVCKMLGRNYIAFEIDPDVAEKARERVQNTQPPLFVLEPEQVEMQLA